MSPSDLKSIKERLRFLKERQRLIKAKWREKKFPCLKETQKFKEYLEDSEKRKYCGNTVLRPMKCFKCCAFCTNPCPACRCWTFSFINRCERRVTFEKARWGKIFDANVLQE